MTQNAVCHGPISRRDFLQAGVLALGGLTLADVLAARAAAGEERRGTSVILLYLHGGPSHLETYDLKPEAPGDYRSVFRPLRTNVPGIEICELFPLQARIADRFSLVRSLHHDVGIHSDGGIVVLTGNRPEQLDPTSNSVSREPDFGSVASRARGPGRGAFPAYISIPRRLYMTRPAYLGAEHAAFEAGDPARPGYAPPELSLPAGLDGGRLRSRRALLGQFDRLRRDLDARGSMTAMDRFTDQALGLLTSAQAARAFDLGREDERLRDRYGRHLWGQGCLLARRLAEAGAAVITLFIDTPRSGQEFTNWDDHILNAGRPGHFAEYMRVRLPYLDQALSALIEDVFARDLQENVLIVAVGEFGRTPRLSRNSSGTGRDHWPQAYSALVSGGGLRMGQVVGATNARGEYPAARPVSPQDLLATVYRHLGIDPRATFDDFRGRPVPILPDGEPIRELL